MTQEVLQTVESRSSDQSWMLQSLPTIHEVATTKRGLHRRSRLDRPALPVRSWTQIEVAADGAIASVMSIVCAASRSGGRLKETRC